MLESMRQNVKKSLQFFIWLVIITFVGAAVIGALSGSLGRSGRQQDAVAWVNGTPISYTSFENEYRDTYNLYKQVYGDNLSQEILDTLQLEQRALNNIAQRILLAEQARAYNLQVSDEELVRKIQEMPQFQRDEHFDRDLYQRLLARVQLTPQDFEERMIESLLIEKLGYLITQTVRISDQEVLDDYTIQNEQLKVEGWQVKAAQFQEQVEVTDEEVSAYYEANKDTYLTPERIKIQYVYFDPQTLKDEVTPAEEEIRQYYEAFKSEFDKGKEVKARHILFKVESDADEETEAAVKGKAEDVFRQIQDGADFAELAKEYSDDPASGENGGDLGFFAKGQMVKEFEEAAFSMEVGNISEPIKTAYGYHIIKVEDIREEEDPYGKAKPEIIERLKLSQAKDIAGEHAEESYQELLDVWDLQQIAEKAGLEVNESDFFGMGEQITPQLAMFPQIQQVAFTLNEDEKFSPPIETQSGYYILEFLERKEPYIPELVEVREIVTNAIRKEKALVEAETEAQKIEAALKAGTAWEEIAEHFSAEKFTPRAFNRRQQYVSEARGKTEEFIKIAFSLEDDTFSPVVELQDVYCIIKVVERVAADTEKFEQEKESLKQQLLSQKQNAVFREFTETLTQNAEITTSELFNL